jgi:hypothetical protein
LASISQPIKRRALAQRCEARCACSRERVGDEITRTREVTDEPLESANVLAPGVVALVGVRAADHVPAVRPVRRGLALPHNVHGLPRIKHSMLVHGRLRVGLEQPCDHPPVAQSACPHRTENVGEDRLPRHRHDGCAIGQNVEREPSELPVKLDGIGGDVGRVGDDRGDTFGSPATNVRDIDPASRRRRRFERRRGPQRWPRQIRPLMLLPARATSHWSRTANPFFD